MNDGEAPIAMVVFQLLLMAAEWLVDCARVGYLELRENMLYKRAYPHSFQRSDLRSLLV